MPFFYCTIILYGFLCQTMISLYHRNGGIMKEKVTKDEFQTEKTKTKRSKTKLVLLSIIAVIVVAIVIDLMLRAPIKPLDMFKLAIERSYDVMEKYYESNDRKSLANALSSGKNLRFNLDGALSLSALGNDLSYNLKTVLDLDPKLENENIYLGLYDGQKEVVDFKAYMLNEKMYLSSPKLYDKLLDLGKYEKTQTADISSIYDFDAWSVILTSKDFVLENLKEENAKVSKTSLEVNGESKILNKYTYAIDENEERELSEKYLEYIDDAIASSELEIGNETYETIKELFEADDEENFQTIYFNLYAEGKNVQGFDIVLGEKMLFNFYYVNDHLDMSLSNLADTEAYEDDYEIDPTFDSSFDKIKFLGVKEKSKMVIHIYTGSEDDLVDLGYITVIEAQNKVNSAKYELEFTIYAEEDSITGSLAVTSEQRGSEKLDSHGNIKFDIDIDGTKIALEFDMNVSEIDEIEKPNTSNVKKIEDISEKEGQKILENLESAIKDTDYEIIFQSIAGVFKTDNSAF